MVDLFSGTGGASSAFQLAGWQVIRVDIDRRHRPSVVADARALPLVGPIDVLWCSPPCTEFSDANPDRPARPSLALMHAAFEAVADLKPRFWVLENVRGAIPYLGIPVQKIGPWCLWGYFPPLQVSFPMQTHRKSEYRTAIDRGAIPFEISEALLRAVELHKSLSSILDLRPFRRHRHVAARTRLTDDAADLFA